jgi:predicted XRE-type DNA-binding protein
MANRKPVKGYEGYYEVSDDGFVYSLDRVVPFGNSTKIIKAKDLKPYVRKRDGRRFVNLKRFGAGDKRTIASLVAESFIGDRPEGLYVLHKDDNLADDSLGNLYYGTPVENAADAKKNGREAYVCGEKHGNNKLSSEQVREIREMAEFTKQKDVAKLYGATQSHVSDIVTGKRRKLG